MIPFRFPHLIVVVLGCLALASCARKPIVLESFSGTKSIQEGEGAQMFWSFKYADSVRLDPPGTLHNPEGHAIVVPTATTEYQLRAFRPGIDTLLHSWKISVAPRNNVATDGEISTGPLSSRPAPMLIRNNTPSKWMQGVSDRQSTASTLRILGAVVRDNRLVYDAIALDANGNSLSNDQCKGQWKVETVCRSTGQEETTFAPPANHSWTTASKAMSTVLCIDNSVIAQSLAKTAIGTIQQMLPGIPGRDSVGIVVFDHGIVELSALTLAADAGRSASPSLVPPPYGLTAMYSAAMNALSMLSSAPTSDRLLVLVAASNDNASLQQSFGSVVARARELGVRIHTIRVGPSAMGYVYRSLAAATGGRSYSLGTAEAASVGDIVREAVFAHRQHLRGSVLIAGGDVPCENVLLRVTLTDGENTVADSIRVPRANLDYRTPYLAVALFPDSTTESVRAFYPTLAMLAEELLENPDLRVELVGHAGRDVIKDAVQISYDRARTVADALLGWGVKPKSIQVRSEGSSKPLYYFQLEEWQRRMNNRVEVRYVTSDPVPYIVVVDQVASEDQAEKLVNTWKDRNFKAYFEPVMAQRNPAYKVALWGYASYDDALRVSRDVTKKYKIQATVE